MKTIGLLGGMSWESTISYYEAINEGIKQALGGLHSAKICLFSVDFQEVATLQREGRWQDAAEILCKAAQSVEAGGADFLLICTNTMHKVADEIQAAINIPLLHIVDATAAKLQLDGVDRVGLLGTKFTMEERFYTSRFEETYGISVLVPDTEDRNLVHRIIFEELCLGEINETSRASYLNVVDHLHARGAQAVVLGCTEIALLLQQRHSPVPLYDTTQLHAEQAVSLALS